MNSKNIKKSLTAKIEDWLKHIDNPDIVKVIRDNAIITGGSIVSLLNGDDPNDYDIYFRTKDACIKIAEYYAEIFNKSHDKEVVIRVEDDRVKCFIQSKGIAAEEGAETITDETEPYVESESVCH